MTEEGYSLFGIEHDSRGADLLGGDFTRAWFTQAVLVSVRPTGAILYRADLQSADLTGSDLTGADLVRANLDGARYYFRANHCFRRGTVSRAGRVGTRGMDRRERRASSGDTSQQHAEVASRFGGSQYQQTPVRRCGGGRAHRRQGGRRR
ncbi:pentapeptide repeat-containing protein [Streptomyces anulatus]|uniref:pentapeptide repeat-containing protein n=1 Tax=Streptomyces anulatus TaxID=1892 RepID=UPI0036989F50